MLINRNHSFGCCGCVQVKWTKDVGISCVEGHLSIGVAVSSNLHDALVNKALRNTGYKRVNASDDGARHTQQLVGFNKAARAATGEIHKFGVVDLQVPRQHAVDKCLSAGTARAAVREDQRLHDLPQGHAALRCGVPALASSLLLLHNTELDALLIEPRVGSRTACQHQYRLGRCHWRAIAAPAHQEPWALAVCAPHSCGWEDTATGPGGGEGEGGEQRDSQLQSRGTPPAE